MTQSFPLPAPAQPKRRIRIWRTITALMLREMSTTYGRSALGYPWAILEPVAGIMLLTFVFSLSFRAPSLGTSFPLFFATGMLPFLAYQDVSQKISVALRFSRQLLFYPGVTYMDALIARFLLNAFTQMLIATLVLSTIVIAYDLDVILNPPMIALGFTMAFAIAIGVGTLNCFLLSVFPIWERTWGIINRPLFIISCIIFLFDTVPQPYQDWLWWNPLIHPIGAVRKGLYPTYDAAYLSPGYVFAVSLILCAIGLLLLRRYHRDIANN